MKFTLLIYLDPAFYELPKDEQNRIHQACGAWHEKLVASGQSVSCEGLQPVATATTVRRRFGKSLITDGPFAETKEVLGGFEIVECKDLDEALAIARDFPGLDVGTAVEVRPNVPGGKCEAV